MNGIVHVEILLPVVPKGGDGLENRQGGGDGDGG